jgi:hypothetical protein
MTPTVPVYGAEEFLLIRQVEQRIKTIEDLITKLPIAEAGKTLEEISSKTADLKNVLFKDLDNLKEKYSEISSVLGRLRSDILQNYQKGLVDSQRELLNFIDTNKNYIRDFTTAGTSGVTTLEELKLKMADLSQKMIESIRTGEVTAVAATNTAKTALEDAIKNAFKEDEAKTSISPLLDRVIGKESDIRDRLSSSGNDIQRFIQSFSSTGEEQILQDLQELFKLLKPDINLRNISELTAAFNEFTQGSPGAPKTRDMQLAELSASMLKLAQTQAYVASASQTLSENYRKQAEIELAVNKNQQLLVNSGKEVTNYFGNLADKIALASSNTNIFGAMLVNYAANAAATADEKTGKLNFSFGALRQTITSSLATSFLDPEKAANRLFNFLNENVIQSSLKFDALAAGVGKTTGGFRSEFEEVALRNFGTAMPQLAKYGLSIKEAAEAYGSLSKQISGFNNMSDASRRLLTEQATEFKMLGLSADQYGKLAATAIGSFGKDAAQANAYIKDLAKDAISLGKDLGSYATEFQGMVGKLSGYAEEAKDIFKSLSGIATATKGVLSASDLTALSDQFKTFDSAAEAANKLSAAFGGVSINAVEIMKMNPAEQILEIKRAADASGKSFGDLNIGYKRMIAELFGGDVSKAAAFFKMDMAAATAEIEKQAASEEELNKRKEASAAAQEKLNAAFENLKLAITPIANALGFVANAINSITSVFGPLPVVLTTILSLSKLMGVSFLSFGNAAKMGSNKAQTELRLLQEEAKYAIELQRAAKAGEPVPLEPASLVKARAEAAATGGPALPFGGGGGGGGGGVRGFIGANKGFLIGAALIGAGALIDSFTKKPETSEVEDGLITVSKAGKTNVVKISDQDDVKIAASKAGGPLASYSSEQDSVTSNTILNSFYNYAQNIGSSLYENTKNLTTSFISEGAGFFSNIASNIERTFLDTQNSNTVELQKVSSNTLKESVAKLQESSASVKTEERNILTNTIRETNKQLITETKAIMPESLAITLKPTFTEGYAQEMFNIGLEKSRRIA